MCVKQGAFVDAITMNDKTIRHNNNNNNNNKEGGAQIFRCRKTGLSNVLVVFTTRYLAL